MKSEQTTQFGFLKCKFMLLSHASPFPQKSKSAVMQEVQPGHKGQLTISLTTE